MSTPALNKYPLDLTAEALSNRITGEQWTIPQYVQRTIVPREGVFYGHGFELRQVGNPTPLERNKDYRFLELNSEITVRSGHAAFFIIQLLNPDVYGDVELDYQVPGGSYVTYPDTVAAYLQLLNLDDRPVAWVNLVGAPVQFPPAPHLHHASELYGMEDVRDALLDIAEKIEISAALQAQVAYLTEEVNRLTENAKVVLVSTDVFSALPGRNYMVTANNVNVFLPLLNTVPIGSIVTVDTADDTFTAVITVNDVANELILFNNQTAPSVNYSNVMTIRFIKINDTTWRARL